MLLVPRRARAYVNHGRWVVDCTRPHCAGAERLSPGQTSVHCANCRLVQDVEWPADPDGIWEVLERRPVPQTRNWAPAGHRQSVACGLPDGQTVADLVRESAEYGVV